MLDISPQNLSLLTSASTQALHGALTRGSTHRVQADRDRGAVSLEQVLWFVAAGVSVAVIAAILWSQIRTQANTPVTPPAAP